MQKHTIIFTKLQNKTTIDRLFHIDGLACLFFRNFYFLFLKNVLSFYIVDSQFCNMEPYRSGHNEADSKSVCRGLPGTRVRIPPAPFYTHSSLNTHTEITHFCPYERGAVMNQLYKQILSLVKSSIQGEAFTPNTPIPWKDAYHILVTGKLVGIVYRKVNELPENCRPDEDIMNSWKNMVFQRGFHQLLSFQELGHVLREAEKKGLHPVVFKGIALADLYPEANMRFSSDSDILIPPEERSAMETLLQELGYSFIEIASKQHVPVYKIQQPNRYLKIELHDCLWEDYTGLQAELLEELNLTTPDTLLQTTACKIPITTLGYEQHLIYQIFHIAKHFAFEGLPLRYLVDLTVFVNAYHNQIDAAHFWAIMKKLKYDVFCDAIFKICIHYFDMDNSLLSAEYRKYELNEDLLVDILTVGRKEGDASEAWAGTDTLSRYLMRDTQATSNRFSQKIHMIFPTPSELKDKFSYAKKYKILLPFAWIHRFFSAISYSRYCKKQGTSSNDAYNKINHRLELMKDLEMVDFK